MLFFHISFLTILWCFNYILDDMEQQLICFVLLNLRRLWFYEEFRFIQTIHLMVFSLLFLPFKKIL